MHSHKELRGTLRENLHTIALLKTESSEPSVTLYSHSISFGARVFMKNCNPYTVTNCPRVFSTREVMNMSQAERRSWNLQFKPPRLGVASDGFGQFEATPSSAYRHHLQPIMAH